MEPTRDSSWSHFLPSNQQTYVTSVTDDDDLAAEDHNDEDDMKI